MNFESDFRKSLIIKDLQKLSEVLICKLSRRRKSEPLLDLRVLRRRPTERPTASCESAFFGLKRWGESRGKRHPAAPGGECRAAARRRKRMLTRRARCPAHQDALRDGKSASRKREGPEHLIEAAVEVVVLTDVFDLHGVEPALTASKRTLVSACMGSNRALVSACIPFIRPLIWLNIAIMVTNRSISSTSLTIVLQSKVRPLSSAGAKVLKMAFFLERSLQTRRSQKSGYSAFLGSTPVFSSRRVTRPSKTRSTSCMASC